MGIRYYAYAFDADHSEAALTDPRAFISSDPLADAWGFEPHARLAWATFEPRVPERDLLYLDKAWPDLQALTLLTSPPGVARPAYRMFEGDVTVSVDGWSWDPWVRALAPTEIRLIAEDLDDLDADVGGDRLRGPMRTDCDYVLHFLEQARRFTSGLARDGRGMAYLIG